MLKLLSSGFVRLLDVIDLIVPVPASNQRSIERGADIVGSLAKHLGCRISIPTIQMLVRNYDLGRAKDLNRSEIESQYSFRLCSTLGVSDRHILLIDDVATRGYTARACAKLLKNNGCSNVYLLTLAQSESSLQSERHHQATRD